MQDVALVIFGVIEKEIETDAESERVLEVFLSPCKKVEEIYYRDSSIEDGERPSFIED